MIEIHTCINLGHILTFAKFVLHSMSTRAAVGQQFELSNQMSMPADFFFFVEKNEAGNI